jgi:lipoate-protein ligase A
VSGWVVERASGTAAEHHRRDVPDDGRRHAWVLAVERPALVLGSVQPDADVDAAVAVGLGVDVVRRRSGGGAVLVEPAGIAWIDLAVPRGDDLWHDDVAVAAEWVGEAWVAALAALGRPGGLVHRGGLVRTELAPVVCFAGTGPGEVLVDGCKVVGISQRRTRAGARFQCSVPLTWDVERHASLLAPGIARVRAGADPVEAVSGLPVMPLAGRAAAEVADALLTTLP